MNLFQIDTRVWLRGFGADSLDAVPDAELDRLTALGFNWVWLLGVWQTGELGREYSRGLFPNVDPSEVCGSCFAVTAYEAADWLGGNAALDRMRARLRQRGIRLMLDFVANHTALDHPWAREHRDFYVAGTDFEGLAYGRDPNFPGWPDTLQLNYGSAELQAAMVGELRRIASMCDGVRCDMAMLLLPDVFLRTWGIRMEAFWTKATVAARSVHPEFAFMAEVYWDLEWTLLEQGFDFAYDKRLYDRLRHGNAAGVREHLTAPLDYQEKLARFLENHDEDRAEAAFPGDRQAAAAVATYGAPGLRFFHLGQIEGWRQRASVHLCDRPAEDGDPSRAAFYRRLSELAAPANWRLLTCVEGWDGNPTYINYLAYGGDGALIVVNYGTTQGQCYVETGLTGYYRLSDAFSGVTYEREGNRLYVDLPAWGYYWFRVETHPQAISI